LNPNGTKTGMTGLPKRQLVLIIPTWTKLRM